LGRVGEDLHVVLVLKAERSAKTTSVTSREPAWAYSCSAICSDVPDQVDGELFRSRWKDLAAIPVALLASAGSTTALTLPAVPEWVLPPHGTTACAAARRRIA